MRGALRNYRLSSMGDLDKTLNLLQNKTRRLILERLVREPHYPMQLAELIGISQQAIKKNLRELENGGFVEKMRVASEKADLQELFSESRRLFHYGLILALIFSR